MLEACEDIHDFTADIGFYEFENNNSSGVIVIIYMDITEKVRAIAKKKILFLPHAVNQMISPARMIATWEVRQVVLEGEENEMHVLWGRNAERLCPVSL